MARLKYVFPCAAIAFILLIFVDCLPQLGRPLRHDADRRRWRVPDSILCLLITVVYAVTAFIGLGNTEGIESFCTFRESGQYALITLDEPTRLGTVRYYSGLNTGLYYFQVSSDGEFFETVAEMNQQYKDLFKWNTLQLSTPPVAPVRYFRIVSASAGLRLGELAVSDADGKLLSPEDMSIPAGCAPLFDEQEKIPEKQDFHNSTYFDEIYHARTALEHIENVKPYEISHPPLGKLLLGLGIRLFGMVPFGWRFSGTLIGVLMLPAMYVFLKKMFGGTLVPAACTAVFASDFMHFVQTRIATIDSYVVFFILLMYLFFWLYWQSDRSDVKCWLPPLALSGVCFGLGAASKWTGIYAGAGLGVLWLLDRIFRAHAMYAAKEQRAYWKETERNVLCCLLFFVAVPALIYYLSYWPYGTAAGMSGPGMLFSREYFDIVVGNQKYMFSYHSGVHSTHPYSSVWWQWLLDVRPILYYLEYFDDGTRSSFGAWLNPMLCWGGLAAMLCMGYRAVSRRDRTALFILIGYLAQLIPWVFVTRVVFEYHYFPSSLFLLLALGHVFAVAEAHHPRPRWIVLSFTGVSVVLFAVFYPVLSGARVSAALASGLLQWLPSWPF